MRLTNHAAGLELDLVEAYSAHGDPARLIRDFDQRLLEHAVFMRTRARSHRRLFVGGVAVGFLKSGRPVVLEGANNSPIRGVPRDCAEMDVLKWFQKRECDTIGSLHVAHNGDADVIEGVTGLRMPTLDMCSDCRGLYAVHPGVSEDLPITTYNCDTKARVTQAFGQVLIRYASVEPPLPSLLLLQGAVSAS